MSVPASPSTTTAAEPGIGASIRRGVLAGAAVLAMALPPGLHAIPSASADGAAASGVQRLQPLPRDLDQIMAGWQGLSADARQTARWIVGAHDHAGQDFVIVDKKTATLHVFAADARLRASTRVLIGAARGDDSVPDIGARPIAEVLPHERTTPAGRFVAERGRNTLGEDVVWVDYAAAVSMHRVRTTNPLEHRLERLATPTTEDKRISYGCINIPAAFFDDYIRPLFIDRRAVVYVLPEVKTVEAVFGFLAAAATDSQQTAFGVARHDRTLTAGADLTAW